MLPNHAPWPPPELSFLTRRPSISSYGVANGRRASAAATPPAGSPMSTGSRNSSPPRAGSADFASGDITPPTIPFRSESPLPDVDFSSSRQSTFVPEYALFDLYSNEYEYLPIRPDQVRLLALHAGKHDQAVHCSLKTMLVSELEGSQVGYHALSYAWGEESRVKIYISDVSPGTGDPSLEWHGHSLKELYIRTNLHTALKRLRCEDRDVWFWIDAICINQKDIGEKSHQIPRMLDIYGNAWGACIWLGEAETVTRLDNTCRDPLDFVSVIVNLKLLDRIINGDVAEETLAAFVSFANLLKRPWFRRRWVIQEVAASKRAFVQCGRRKVNWIDFADAVQLFLANIDRIRTIYERSKLYQWNPDAFGHVESVGAGAIVRAASSVLRKSEEGKIVARVWDLESLVVTFLHYEASDTRDTIYALLGLANDRNLYFALQSYKKSTAQVYAEFVQHCINSSNSLDIICRYWALSPKDQSGSELPSWAGVVTNSPYGPSPKATGRLNGDTLVGQPGHRIYNASRGSYPMVRLAFPNVTTLPPIRAPWDFKVALAKEPTAELLWKSLSASEKYAGLWRIQTASDQPRATRIETEVQKLAAGHKPVRAKLGETDSHSLTNRTDYSRHLRTLTPAELQEASKRADERRKRNVAAAARFRARRMEREQQTVREANNLKEDVEFYRKERDALVEILSSSSLPYPPRPKSPRALRLLGDSNSTGVEQNNDSHIRNVNQNKSKNHTPAIYRTDSTVKTFSTAPTGNTSQSNNMDGVEYSKQAGSSPGSSPGGFSAIDTGPQLGSQNISEASAVLSGDPISTQPSSQLVPATQSKINNGSRTVLNFGPHITLITTGFLLCRITQVSSRVVDGVISHDCLEIAGWDRRTDINDIPDRLWRTLVANRTENGSNAPSWWRRACMYALSKTSPEGDLNTSKLIANRSIPETVLEFLKRVQANVWNRRFFACRNAPGGLGSRNIQEGDWCCILLGCSVPVVLREEEKPFFRFVGECYVDGMMDGQAMAMMKEKQLRTSEFPIR